MALSFAFAAAMSTALGMFLTKSVTQRLPGFQTVGVLFIYNAVVAAPVFILKPTWSHLRIVDCLRLFVGGTTTALGAWLIFLIVSRSLASAAAIGQSLSPAAMLVISAYFLHSRATLAQTLLVILIVAAALYPLRNAVEGISSLNTVLLIGLIGITGGVNTAIISQHLKAHLGLVQIIVIQQIVAGLWFLIFYRPKGFTLRDHLSLSRRSVFMGGAWIFTSYALTHGSPVLVQSVTATVPILTLGLETIAYRRSPSAGVMISAVVAGAGICVLALMY
ncbi:MAG: EamA family transporter [Actinomycetes bacterium]